MTGSGGGGAKGGVWSSLRLMAQEGRVFDWDDEPASPVSPVSPTSPTISSFLNSGSSKGLKMAVPSREVRLPLGGEAIPAAELMDRASKVSCQPEIKI